MHSSLLRSCLTIGLFAALAGPLTAQSVTVAYDAGTTNFTTAISGFATGGDDMDGMVVTAVFTDGSSETAIFATTGFDAGVAAGTNWSLGMSGPTTFNWCFTISNNTGLGMTQMVIDAGPGDTLFDTRALGDIFGTPGTFRGLDFTLCGPNPTYLQILATYRDYVALEGAAPVGDLFRELDVQFQNAGGLASGNNVNFATDTDNLLFAGDLNAPPEITCNDAVVLWSPDHTLVDASSAISVSDPDGDPVTVTLRVFSDETEVPETGDGSGKHAPDFKDEYTSPGGRGLLLRSERQGKGDGRYYLAVVTATDDNGAVSTAVCVIAVVPHDQNNPASLDAVLAEAAAARDALQTAVDGGSSLPIAGQTEHGLADELGPKQ